MENNLAENIRSFRKNLGFTQEQLAERLGITLAAVSKWERGTSEPDLAYIMDLAEIFHVSVDALIGFSMHSGDADTEADRIEEMGGVEDISRIISEYETALKKFPNHFRIVLGAAMSYAQAGVMYRQDDKLKRALELLPHAIDLISQNRDPDINEVLLRDEIAACYSALKDNKRAIEEYKKNNLTGSNNARIGALLTLYEKKPEEGIRYTEKAFFGGISDIITTMLGYTDYYIFKGRHEEGLRAAGWAVRFMESLKEDPGKPAYVDKLIPLYYLGMAILQDGAGLTEASEERLRTAVRIARAFDDDPVYTLENITQLINLGDKSVYDDSGPTATDGLKRFLEELGGYVSEAFREKLNREIEAAKQ